MSRLMFATAARDVRKAIGGLVLVCAFAVLLTPQVARAELTQFYSYGEPHCGYNSQSGSRAWAWSDPVTLIFRDLYRHGFAYVVDDVVQHGWGTNTQGGPQWIVNGTTGCRLMDAQRATTCPSSPSPPFGFACTRYHVRFFRITPLENSYHTFATPHHEDWVSVSINCSSWWTCRPRICGHAVDSNGPEGSGFEQGKARMVNLFSDTQISSMFVGNSQSVKQCDDDMAGNEDGIVFWIFSGTWPDGSPK
jgi:hypothetical protein